MRKKQGRGLPRVANSDDGNVDDGTPTRAPSPVVGRQTRGRAQHDKPGAEQESGGPRRSSRTALKAAPAKAKASKPAAQKGSDTRKRAASTTEPKDKAGPKKRKSNVALGGLPDDTEDGFEVPPMTLEATASARKNEAGEASDDALDGARAVAPPAGASHAERGLYFGDGLDDETQGVDPSDDEAIEGDEQWAVVESGEDEGGGGRKKAGGIDRQFRLGVPQWNDTDAQVTPLVASERQVHLAAAANLSDFDDNDGPPPASKKKTDVLVTTSSTAQGSARTDRTSTATQVHSTTRGTTPEDARRRSASSVRAGTQRSSNVEDEEDATSGTRSTAILAGSEQRAYVTVSTVRRPHENQDGGATSAGRDQRRRVNPVTVRRRVKERSYEDGAGGRYATEASRGREQRARVNVVTVRRFEEQDGEDSGAGGHVSATAASAARRKQRGRVVVVGDSDEDDLDRSEHVSDGRASVPLPLDGLTIGDERGGRPQSPDRGRDGGVQGQGRAGGAERRAGANEPSTARTQGGASTWPAWTDFVPPSKGRRMAIGDQSPQIQKVISHAVQNQLPKLMCFKTAYPGPTVREEYLVEVVAQAALELNFKPIADRLAEDVLLGDYMIKVPEARMSTLRHKMKKGADDLVLKAYNLADIPEQKFVKYMSKVRRPGLKGRLYIFPCDISKLDFDTSQPFCNEAIIELIYNKFFGPSAAHRFPRSAYVAVSEGRNRPELPPAMIALAATAIDASLSAYMLELRPGKVDFTADAFKPVYLEHIARMKNLKSRSADAFAGLLAHLYNEVVAVGGHRDDDDMAAIGAAAGFNDADMEEDVIDVDDFVANFG
ncbi:hypothetical protein FA95DRAFT_1613913 [Auriscalpium vulgare]|uniref:Uncharacterized protein n=1 Tax=Auriscalpium vulgare TaxID=40419 RepID=A0ACB8R0U2_9AGAM|nr:hypothetical protein FA95DRAFT_1613913 [Auriscalpium vulgare]